MFSFRSAGCLLLLSASFSLLQPQTLQAASKPERVRFDTFDQVELHGSFYPSDRGGGAPCVLLLHPVGSGRRHDGLERLAERLQKHYAVLSFDFRGHGDSTEVATGPTGFWSHRANRLLAGARPDKGTISYKDFPRNGAYHPFLANDIAAVRHFLDLQCNAGRCNSANLILIGAGDGATLGALWLAAEWHRQDRVANRFGLAVAQGSPEGKDVACAVWLSLSPTLGGRRMPLENWFTNLSPEVARKVPMFCLYGAGDSAAERTARSLVTALTAGKRPDQADALTGSRSLTPTRLSGLDLLNKGALQTEELILKYLETVFDEKGENPPEKQQLGEAPEPVPVQLFLR